MSRADPIRECELGIEWLREHAAKKRAEVRDLERLAWKMEHKLKELRRLTAERVEP